MNLDFPDGQMQPREQVRRTLASVIGLASARRALWRQLKETPA